MLLPAVARLENWARCRDRWPAVVMSLAAEDKSERRWKPEESCLFARGSEESAPVCAGPGIRAGIDPGLTVADVDDPPDLWSVTGFSMCVS